MYPLLQCLQSHWFCMKNTESIWLFPNAMFLLKKHTSKNIKTTRCFSIKIALLNTILHSSDEFWCAHRYKRTAKTTFIFLKISTLPQTICFRSPNAPNWHTHCSISYKIIDFEWRTSNELDHLHKHRFRWKKYVSKTIKTARCFSFEIAFFSCDRTK